MNFISLKLTCKGIQDACPCTLIKIILIKVAHTDGTNARVGQPENATVA